MKKFIALFLLTAILLTGCGSNTDIPDTTVPLPTDVIDTPTEGATNIDSTPMPMITVSVPVVKSEVTTADGTVIFRDIRQNMQLVMPDQDVADKIIIDFLSRIDQMGSASEEIAEQANTAYTTGNTWTPYLCSISYAPMRIDQSVLSLYGSSLRYSGDRRNVSQRACR